MRILTLSAIVAAAIAPPLANAAFPTNGGAQPGFFSSSSSPGFFASDQPPPQALQPQVAPMIPPRWMGPVYRATPVAGVPTMTVTPEGYLIQAPVIEPVTVPMSPVEAQMNRVETINAGAMANPVAPADPNAFNGMTDSRRR